MTSIFSAKRDSAKENRERELEQQIEFYRIKAEQANASGYFNGISEMHNVTGLDLNALAIE